MEAAAATLLLSADAPLAAGRRLPSRAARAGRRCAAAGPTSRWTSVRAYAAAAAPAPASGNGLIAHNAVYTVGDFMTSKEDLHVVKPSTTVDEALEMLVQHRISGFPVIDDNWMLTFREIQKLLSKTSGKVIGDVMTPKPLVVRETTNLDAAARLLLETKYHRLPVVDSTGKLVGMITRGNVVRAALKIKKKAEEDA